MNRSPLSLCAAAVAAVALGACAKGGDEGADQKVQAVVAAQVAPVATQPFTETVDALGTVVPRAGHVASLSAPSATRVSRVYVTFGAHVKAGDPLVEFEQPSFDAAAREADASLVAAERAAERTQRLAEEGVLPRKDADVAVADLAAARLNDVNARRAQVLSTVRSPIDGVVTRMNAVLGANADPTQVMVDVADPSTLDVLLTVSPADAARVAVGQHVAFHAEASALAPAVADGRVADIAAAVDTASRGVAVRVEVEPRSRGLRIGQTLFGRITVAEHSRAVVVPLNALVPTGEGFKVFVVDAKGMAQSRDVTIGGRTDRAAWITAGLRAGETIVTEGAYGVDDSAMVAAPGAARGARGAKGAAPVPPGGAP